MSNESGIINKRRTARIISVACGLLFSVFSVVYLSVLQKDVMEALHYSLAQGKTVYASLTSAVVITLVLLLFRWGVNVLVGLKGVFKALSYFPVFLLLGILTDVGYEVYSGEGISPQWMWLFPVLLLVYVLLGLVLRKLACWIEGSDIKPEVSVCSNLFVLVMLCFLTVGMGNTNIHFHHELQIEKALRKQDFEAARRVGLKSMDPSRNLTALRAYALSREGTMGEYLFQYPQLYGAGGLLIGASDDKVLLMDADSLYVYLGERPGLGEPVLDFFRRISKEETGNYTTLDYYLCALLLEKKLDEFVDEFERSYTGRDSIIPYYYRQALFLYDKMQGKTVSEGSDKVMEELWSKYMAMKMELSGQTGEGNLMRRLYGNTYWWYYQYH